MNVKIFSVRLAIAALTFVIGGAAARGWFYYNYQPKVKVIETYLDLDASGYMDHEIPESDEQFREILDKFIEPSMKNISLEIDESYRFTLIPTFSEPVSIRIWRTNNRYFLIAKKLSGKGGFDIQKFGSLSFEKTHELTADDWFKFASLIDNSWFWSEPSSAKETVIGDSAEWIMEGVVRERGRGKNYHEVHRFSPKPEFQKAGDYLLKLSEFESDYQDY